MTEDARKLDALKPGDNAIICHNGYGDTQWTTATVARRTKTQIILQSGRRFRSNDGKETGVGGWYHDYLYPATPENMERVVETNRKQATRRMLSEIIGTPRSVLEQLPYALLDQVVDAIDAIKLRRDEDQ